MEHRSQSYRCGGGAAACGDVGFDGEEVGCVDVGGEVATKDGGVDGRFSGRVVVVVPVIRAPPLIPSALSAHSPSGSPLASPEKTRPFALCTTSAALELDPSATASAGGDSAKGFVFSPSSPFKLGRRRLDSSIGNRVRPSVTSTFLSPCVVDVVIFVVVVRRLSDVFPEELTFATASPSTISRS